MIISNATINLTANHEYQETHEVSESLNFWLADTPSSAEADEQVNTDDSNKRWRDPVTFSPQAFSLGLLASRSYKQELNLDSAMDARSRVNLMILQKMFETLTGRSMRIMSPGDLNPSANIRTMSLETPLPASAFPVPESAGFGLVYGRHERYQETEKMQFQAAGMIKTADGREISFSSSLSMSRAYYEESSLIVRQGDATRIDPLVINFDGKGADLSQTRFAFDLDNDGSTEQIARLRPGSGFLALDRNGDGVINNGSELFGPDSGYGFAELAQYDEDGNHFIDEADSIYSQLRIWTLNEDGSSQLAALGDKQVGAIFLGHVTSPFQFKDNENTSLGEVAATGIYLSEGGEIGIVQEINLTV